MGFYDGATGLGTGTATVPSAVTSIESILSSLGGTRFKSPAQNLADRQKAIDAMLALALSGNAGAVKQLIDWSGFHGEYGSIATDAAKQYDRRALVQYYARSAVAVPSDLAAFLGINPGVQPPSPSVVNPLLHSAGMALGSIDSTTLALGVAGAIAWLALRKRPRRAARRR